MIDKRLPRPAAFDEGLHQSTLGLDGVHEIVTGPLVQQMAEGDRPQLGVDGLARQIGEGEAIEQAQALGAQRGNSAASSIGGFVAWATVPCRSGS